MYFNLHKKEVYISMHNIKCNFYDLIILSITIGYKCYFIAIREYKLMLK